MPALPNYRRRKLSDGRLGPKKVLVSTSVGSGGSFFRHSLGGPGIRLSGGGVGVARWCALIGPLRLPLMFK